MRKTIEEWDKGQRTPLASGLQEEENRVHVLEKEQNV